MTFGQPVVLPAVIASVGDLKRLNWSQSSWQPLSANLFRNSLQESNANTEAELFTEEQENSLRPEPRVN